MEPSYLFKDFKNACKKRKKYVAVVRGARQTAKNDFKLNTEEAIIDFIGNGGLEKLKFERTKLWENNPNFEIPIMVDSYGFYSGMLYGYIAFLFNECIDKWIVKSFKKNTDPDLRFMPFKNLKLH